jgi:hypothetical protein
MPYREGGWTVRRLVHHISGIENCWNCWCSTGDDL